MDVWSHFRNGKSLRKIVSIFVLQSFLLSNFVLADTLQAKTDVAQKKQSIVNPNDIVIQKDHGLVKSKFAGNSKKIIINIQDAHCNYEAQTNIVNILEGLINNYSLSLVSVEGADGLIDTTWFKAFPDEEVRKEVATYFMKKGEITGPEYLSITKDYKITLFGAEDRVSYIQNLNAFTSSYPLKADTEKYYNSIKSALNRLKGFIYNDGLKAMDTRAADYESKKLQFNDYIRFLQEMAEKTKINIRSYDNFFRLVSVLIYEKKIDFTVTDKERSALIDELSKLLSKDALTELVSQSIAFKAGKISSAEFYAFLKKSALDNNIDISKNYPNLYNYIIYNSVYSRIENEKLFNDIKELESAIKEKFFANDDQRSLEKLSRHVEMLLGMVNIKLLNNDFTYYQTHREEFNHEVFADFIKKEGVKYGLAYEIEPPSDTVAKAMPKLEDFYTIATKRDKALIENTLAEMDREKQDVAVLVTGGFHSEGMAKLLEKQGVSYVVVCPTITKDVPTPYIQILTNQKTPFDDIMPSPEAAKKGMLAPFLRTELMSMTPQQLEEHLKGIPISAKEVEEIKEALYFKIAYTREHAYSVAIRKWLEIVMKAVSGHSLARNEEFMKARYLDGVAAAIKKTGRPVAASSAATFVDKLIRDLRFNTAFHIEFRRVMPQPETSALSAGDRESSSGKQESVSSAIKKMAAGAGLIPGVINDPKARTDRITEYNVLAGGVRELVAGRSEEEIAPKPAIVTPATKADKIEFLKSVARGERAWAVFGAGRASRMKLPAIFDQLGIAGLTPRILKAWPKNDDQLTESQLTDEMRRLIEDAKRGVIRDSDDISIIQRQLIRLRMQIKQLVDENPEAGVTVEKALAGAGFIDVVNEDNKEAMANQLAAIGFAGLKAKNVYLIEQPEEGGEEILPNGRTQWLDSERWPEGHGDPFIAIAQRPEDAFTITDGGELVPLGDTLRNALVAKGMTKAIFAQVNDLHLIENMAGVERWKTILALMQEEKAEMVMEVVENKITVQGKVTKQKGGATFNKPGSSFVVMRDTLALKTKDLEKFAFPESLSRMFYGVDLVSLNKVTEDSIPAYLNERETRTDKKAVLTREFYSGDASSVLNALTMQEPGCDIYTFKMRSRTDEALKTINEQTNTEGFQRFLAGLLAGNAAARESSSGYALNKTPEDDNILAMQKDATTVKISDSELAITRVFGTNGIRSDDIGIDAQRRIAAGTAEILAAKWKASNPGKALPWVMVGFDPRPQGVNGFRPGEMGESKAVAEVFAAYGFKVLFVPHAVAAPFMISVTGKSVHPRDIYASLMRTASHNEVIDPKSSKLVSGVKVFLNNAPAPDDLTGLISTRINNRELAATAPAVDFNEAVSKGQIIVVKAGDSDDPDTVEFNRLASVFDLAKIGTMFRAKYPDLKIAINTMNGGMSAFAVRVLKAMGFEEGKNFRAFNTTLMNDKSMEAKMTGWVEYTDPATKEAKKVRFAPDPTRPWMRGEEYQSYVSSDPERVIALLIDGDADRLVAELKKEIIPNDIGMLAAYYLAHYKGQTGRIVRTVPTTGGLDALSQALGLGAVQVTPVGSKWFAGPNKYYSGTLNDILVAVEESGHIGYIKTDKAGKGELFFDHSIGLAVLMLEMTAETGKTWQELSDEMWKFIKDNTPTHQERIAAVRYGISKDEGAENYYSLVARLGNPKEDAFRKEFGAKLEHELALANIPWKVSGFDITDSGGAQVQFVGGRKLFPRKSGTDGSVRLYVEVLETERAEAPKLVSVMRKAMDSFLAPEARESSAGSNVIKPASINQISASANDLMKAATGLSQGQVDNMRMRFLRTLDNDPTLINEKVVSISNKPIWVATYATVAGISKTAVFNLESGALLANVANDFGFDVEWMVEGGALVPYKAPYAPGSWPIEKHAAIDVTGILAREYYKDTLSRESSSGIAIDREVVRMVDNAMAGSPVTGKYATDIVRSMEAEASLLRETLLKLKVDKATNNAVVPVVLLFDTGLAPASVAQAGEKAIKRYLGGSIIEVRGTGAQLLENLSAALEGLTEYKIVTIAGDRTLSEIKAVGEDNVAKLGKVINVKSNGNYIPIIGLYDLALRLANDLDLENILQHLNTIAVNGQNQMPFTLDDLRKGIITILPKMGPVTGNETEIYKAAEAVLRSL